MRNPHPACAGESYGSPGLQRESFTLTMATIKTVMNRVARVTCVLGLLAAAGCAQPRPEWVAVGRSGIVASDSFHASQAGVEVLRRGGNAVDAATAVSFALAVTRPYSTGLGGGGFMIARFADGRVVVLDFRETAPAAATADMYVRAAGADPPRPNASRDGHLAVAVPGLVAGRCLALERYGTIALAEALAPAIRLARDGFPVDEHYVESSREALEVYQADPSLTTTCPYVYQLHLAGGRLLRPGDTLKQPRLAALLGQLADQGPDFFYRGPVAEAIEREMARHGGVMKAADLAAYRVRERQPLVTQYRDFTVIGMPPPSSGGVAVAQTLNILSCFDLAGLHRRDEGAAAHVVIEAFKHAFADRARHLADADFAPVPLAELTSPAYARQLAERIRLDRTSSASSASPALETPYGSAQLPDDAGTSHFCVADRWGNVVVSTETINTEFGSLAAVEEWGLILNNEMDDFTTRPGEPNAFGLVQSERNAAAPGKRPLSSMSPTIVLKGDEPALCLGASGGPRIITSVLDVMINVLDYDMSPQRAMTAARPHHQWQPDEVYFDQAPPDLLKAALIARGHAVAEQRRTGIVQAIVREGDTWVGISDPRKGGRPAGY